MIITILQTSESFDAFLVSDVAVHTSDSVATVRKYSSDAGYYSVDSRATGDASELSLTEVALQLSRVMLLS